MSHVSTLGRKAIEEARRGEFDRALATAHDAIAAAPDDSGLRFFAAMLHSRRSEFDEAAGQLRAALKIVGDEPVIRAELIRVLAGAGHIDEAEALLAKPGLPPAVSERLQAAIAAQRGDHSRAVETYRRIVGAEPGDFESWGNLGVSLLCTGDASGAVAALDRALDLKPDHSKFRDKWVDANVAAGTADEALERIRSTRPGDVDALVMTARLEDLQQRPDRAIDALRQALAKQPDHEPALAALADLQERANQIDDFDETLDRLEKAAPTSDKLPLLRARAAFRRGEHEEALRLAEAAPRSVDPAARAQLIGQVNDRLGNGDAAFAAFEEMNRIDSLAADDAQGKTNRHLDALGAQLDILTPEWVGSWAAADSPPPREPAFLVGFPRSGTTLLDTLLMNDSSLVVSEENPMLTEVSKRIGAFARIAELRDPDIGKLRDVYFGEAQKHVPRAAGGLLLDKFPLALGAGPLIHRLFPTAPIIFLARHPCDVVLSCFMTRFQPTESGSAFLTLEGTARLYDAMMSLWARSRELLPLQVLDVRYETLVSDAPKELRRVADFLGLQWSERLLDNRSAAQSRGFIKTPSYSQVAEPIYNRAVERWRRYSDQLAPALPVLKPWIERLGYEA